MYSLISHSKKIFFTFLLLFIVGFSTKVVACSPYGTPILVSQNISGGFLNLVWTSTTAWACTYRINMEVVCNNQSFTGTANYLSGCIVKPTSANMNYPSWAIPLSAFCPGVTYKFRAIEADCGGFVGSLFTPTFTFTVPGAIAPFSVAATATTTNICIPGSSTITATPSGGCGPFTYSWAPGGQTSPSITVSPVVTTTYTVTVQDICSLQSGTANITINALPAPVAGTATVNPAAVCIGQSTTLTLTGSQGAIQWQEGPTGAGPWTNIGGANSATYTTGGLTTATCYRAEVTGCGAAVYSNSVCVSINPNPVVTVSPAVSAFCNGDSVILTGGGANNYTWSPGIGLSASTGTNVTASPTSTTTYTVTGTDVAGCISTSSAIITITASPTATASNTGPYCAGTTIQLNATGGTDYSWSGPLSYSNAIQNPSIASSTPAMTGIYTVTVTDVSVNGCTTTATTTVTVNVLPIADFKLEEYSVSIFKPQVNVTDVSVNAVTWSYNMGDGTLYSSQNPMHTYGDTGIYCIVQWVTSINGCTDSITRCVEIYLQPTIYIPNSFTPNEDESNDMFKAYGVSISSFEMRIFNRWGDEVFYTGSINNGWYGTLKDGSECKQDVYVYKANAIDINGKSYELMGQVNLIR